MLAELYADGLNMTTDDVLRLWDGSKHDKRQLFDMLKAAGIDPATGRHRGGGAAQAAGISVPRLGLDDPRVVRADDLGDRQGDHAGHADDLGDHDHAGGHAEQLLDSRAG
jgi:hypothetical protein